MESPIILSIASIIRFGQSAAARSGHLSITLVQKSRQAILKISSLKLWKRQSVPNGRAQSGAGRFSSARRALGAAEELVKVNQAHASWAPSKTFEDLAGDEVCFRPKPAPVR